MAWSLLIVGFVVGFAIAGKLTARRAKRRGTMVSFRAAGRPQAADPYRGDAVAAVAPSVDELAAALRKAGLEVRARAAGLDVVAGAHAVRLRVADPARVALASIDIADSGPDSLIFEVALALVPLYGPIVVTEALWGAYPVDGRRDHAALVEERGERIRAMAQAIQERIAASQPLWQQLVERR